MNSLLKNRSVLISFQTIKYFTVKQILFRLFKIQKDFGKIVVLLLALLILNNRINAQNQNDLDVLRNNWLLYTDAPNSLYNYLTGEAYKMLEKRAENVSRIQNIEDWQKRQVNVRQKLWDILGAFPEKTPLNAKITGTVKKNGYKVRKYHL